MVRINVNGQYLDVPEDIKVQLVKKNLLFSFDDAQCERSTSFDLPATKHNNIVFGFAGTLNSAGDGMRVRYDSVLEIDTAQTRGYLYITQYDEKQRKYSCVFVGGILRELARLKQLGKLRDFYLPDVTIGWRKANEKAANVANLQPFASVKYYNDWEVENPSACAVPSINLRYLLQHASSSAGITIQLPNDPYLRYVPKKAQRVEKMPVTIKSTKGVDGSDINTATSTATNLLRPASIPYGVHEYQVTEEQPYPLYWTYYAAGSVYNLAGWRVIGGDLAITFPEDFPARVACARALYPYVQGAKLEYIGDFWGDYDALVSIAPGTHLASITTEGAPLARRTIIVPNGEYFAFVNLDDCHILTPYDYNVGDTEHASYFSNGAQSYQLYGQPTYEYKLVISQVNDRAQDNADYDGVSLWANLPDVTLMELFKAFAVLTGKVLYYDETNGVQFLDGSMAAMLNGRTLNLDGRVISAGKITRTFANFAQHNIIKYADDENVLQAEIISNDYPIANVNLQEQNELAVIPWSCAGETVQGSKLVAYVRNNDKMENATELVLKSNAGSEYMRRQSLGTIATINSLCSQSTAVEVEFIMQAWEFETLTGREQIYFSNAYWAWSDAQWQSGKCRMNLQKIA